MAVTQSQITMILPLSFTFYILKNVHLMTGGAPAPGAPVVSMPLLVYVLSRTLDLVGCSSGNIAWQMPSEITDTSAPVSISMTSGLPSTVTSQVSGLGFEEVCAKRCSSSELLTSCISI